jgi:hypothetical protein
MSFDQNSHRWQVVYATIDNPSLNLVGAGFVTDLISLDLPAR